MLARASFGIRGANVPALARAIVACGWFGIQTWIGGAALFDICHIRYPGFAQLPNILPESFGLTTAQTFWFLLFWAFNMWVAARGKDLIRRLLWSKSLILPVLAALLLGWAIWAADGLSPILSRPARWQGAAEFWAFFFPALTGVVAFCAMVALNSPDFTRGAQFQRAHLLGRNLAMPTAMTGFAFVGVVVTSTTALLYGEIIWDPIKVAARFDAPGWVSFALLAVALATLATNLAANLVSPANDFANLAPRYINFRRGGYLTGLFGILMLPWRLVADPTGLYFDSAHRLLESARASRWHCVG